MKKLLSLFVIVITMLSGCKKIDEKINRVNDRVTNLEQRVTTIEELCKQMNTNISSLQDIIVAVQNNDYVTDVTPVLKEDEVVGYTISFTKSEPVTIYHGQNGLDGANGKDGVDGQTPIIGVKLDLDDIYYWTIDGKWLLDETGNKVKAVGANGKDGIDGTSGENGVDGSNGTDGKDGITPQLKIEDGYWFVSYDNGMVWTKLGKATGVDGDTFFQSVTQDENNAYLTLTNGTKITIPLASSYLFNRLQSVSYIPKYSDGKATVFHYGSADESFVEIDFIISPKNAIADIVANWREILSIKAVNAISRAIEFVDMPVLSCEADMQSGVLVVKASGENLANEFFLNASAVNAVLFLSDGNTNISSGYIPLVAEKTEKITEYALISTYKVVSNDQKAIIYRDNIAGDDNPLVNVDYGDGAFGTEKMHTYTNPGEYTVIFYFEKPITEIGTNAFGYGSNISSIIIPKEVTILNNSAFHGAKLETINFEANSQLTKIGDGAFNYCTKLTSIQLPSSVLEIGSAVFGGCSNLLSISGGANYRVDLGIYSKQGEGLHCQTIAFPAACDIETIQFGGLTYELLWGAFSFCKNLRVVDIWIDKIQQYNFMDCAVLESVNLSRTTFVGNNVFTGCPKLQALELPIAKEIGVNSITNNESLTEISLGCNDLKVVNNIGNNNVKLQTIWIPAGVECIQDSFNGNTELANIYCKSITPPVLINSFDAITDAVKVYVPEVSVDAYKTADGWKTFAEYIVGGDF